MQTDVETPKPSGVGTSDLLCVRLRHLDLFSGIGGFALAAQRAGWNTIGFSEIEPYACKILKRHWPDVPNYGDIRNVRGVSADLITGGFPCQPYSLAGKRGGASDDRALWPQMHRVIAEARPAWVLGENVPGIINLELDRVLSDLETIGYTAGALSIPACGVDARHRRERIWIVAADALRQQCQPECSYPTVAANDGPTESLADTKRLRRRQSTGDSETAQRPLDTTERQEGASGLGPGGKTLADGIRAGLEEWQEQSAREERTAAQRSSVAEPRRPALWQPEPELGRVAHGIPHRAHRLRGLGNAIVPQVAEPLLRWMREITQGQDT